MCEYSARGPRTLFVRLFAKFAQQWILRKLQFSVGTLAKERLTRIKTITNIEMSKTGEIYVIVILTNAPQISNSNPNSFEYPKISKYVDVI